MYKFVARSHELIKTLRIKWNAHTYLTQLRLREIDSQDGARFKPSEVRGVLDDNMFEAYNQFILAIGTLLR